MGTFFVTDKDKFYLLESKGANELHCCKHMNGTYCCLSFCSYCLHHHTFDMIIKSFFLVMCSKLIRAYLIIEYFTRTLERSLDFLSSIYAIVLRSLQHGASYFMHSRQMKTATVIATILGNSMRQNVCTETMFLQCKIQTCDFSLWEFNSATPSLHFYKTHVKIILVLFRMDIDFSPTGREFVTGSYDRTVSSSPGYVQLLYCTLRYVLNPSCDWFCR